MLTGYSHLHTLCAFPSRCSLFMVLSVDGSPALSCCTRAGPIIFTSPSPCCTAISVSSPSTSSSLPHLFGLAVFRSFTVTPLSPSRSSCTISVLRVSGASHSALVAAASIALTAQGPSLCRAHRAVSARRSRPSCTWQLTALSAALTCCSVVRVCVTSMRRQSTCGAPARLAAALVCRRLIASAAALPSPAATIRLHLSDEPSIRIRARTRHAPHAFSAPMCSSHVSLPHAAHMCLLGTLPLAGFFPSAAHPAHGR